MTTMERLFGAGHAFDHPVTLWICVGIAVALVVAPALVLTLGATGRIDADTRRELVARCRTWVVLAALIVGPVLLGAAWTIGAICVLALLCYREFARATGLFRERSVSAVVALSIVLTMLAALDHWYDLFMAMGALSCVAVATVAILRDQPKGYVQRVGLGFVAVALFASGLGHAAYMANDELYRPILLWLVVGIELNDVFAYITGRLFGRRKLCPQTSPNKTVAGSLGALVLTTLLVGGIGHVLFAGTPLDSPVHLGALGLLVSVTGQLGDLMVSSVKRDIGVKDLGGVLPGHGGMLDRFDSLLLAAPAVFHYVGYFRPGFGLDQASRILTGEM